MSPRRMISRSLVGRLSSMTSDGASFGRAVNWSMQGLSDSYYPTTYSTALHFAPYLAHWHHLVLTLAHKCARIPLCLIVIGTFRGPYVPHLPVFRRDLYR